MRYNTPVSRLPLLLPLLAGCAQWPRYEHLTGAGDPQAIPAGSDPAAAVTIEWIGSFSEVDGQGLSGLPVGTIADLGPDQGILINGTLSGAGWAGDLSPDRDGSCGTLAFPYGLEGSYAGDIDWAAVHLAREGYLCATVEIDHPSARYDLVPYLLDECQEPGAALVDEADQTWGYGLSGPSSTWAAPIPADTSIALALAAFWPQDNSAAIPWRLGLSHSTSGPCPLLPEAE